MECRDVREMADSFLAEELLTETNHEILRHLETCPVCRADLAARRALREGVRRAFRDASDLDPRPEFMTQLRASLQDAAYYAPARRRMRFHGWWALAATVLLAVALGVAYRGREWITATATLARAAVGDHRNCALQFRLADFRGERVSLLVRAVEGSVQLALPEEALPHVTSAGRIDDMSVVSFRAAGHMVFLAGDVAEADLMTLANTVAGPLYRELAGA